MSKVFSVASWNVEHFAGKKKDADAKKKKKERVKRVAKYISGEIGDLTSVPDVFVLYEVEGKDMYKEFMKKFPKHRFHLTEGKQTQEIFVGVHKDLQTFSTQRLEFKTGREFQRPGLLLSLRKDEVDYTLLFLHVRSGDGTEDFGLRDAALKHAFNLKVALDKVDDTKANFIFLGDLNTMGTDDPAPYCKIMDMDPQDEIDRIAYWATKRKMKLLAKETTSIEGVQKEVTWYNGSSGYKPSNLDHVVASDQMTIKGSAQDVVSVLGWPKSAKSKWKKWFKDYSDHAMLYFEVW